MVKPQVKAQQQVEVQQKAFARQQEQMEQQQECAEAGTQEATQVRGQVAILVPGSVAALRFAAKAEACAQKVQL